LSELGWKVPALCPVPRPKVTVNQISWKSNQLLRSLTKILALTILVGYYDSQIYQLSHYGDVTAVWAWLLSFFRVSKLTDIYLSAVGILSSVGLFAGTIWPISRFDS